ncbi:DinB family protein [Paracidobacterium acidisoli]|nr:DinB family protein [Paracidobacterium acidisoli]MBT9331069.1 DinB family protein [Paracidobacterium acidisoli]
MKETEDREQQAERTAPSLRPPQQPRVPGRPVPAWFERKFAFTFPVEQYPNLCVRLLGAPVRLEELLHSASASALTAKPEGKWSAQEHAGHLPDMEPLWLARVEDFLSGSGTLTVADLANRKTHEAGHNDHPPAEILAAFRAARLRLLDRVEALDPARFSASLLHPRLQQPMRLVDHLYFIAEHDDHHLAHIFELIRP